MQEITALVRPDCSKASSVAKLQGVHHIVAVDLGGPQDDLVSALKGTDCVMCILPPHCTTQQISLADAALTAKVKRFIPNMWSTPCPPKGVMSIQEWVSEHIRTSLNCDIGIPQRYCCCTEGLSLLNEQKEDIVNHLKRIRMPYTIIDIVYWHEIMIPRIELERLNHRALYSTFYFVDDGSALCATTYLSDVGRYVERIIADSRTLNRMVFAYGEITTQRAAVDMIERLNGEKCQVQVVKSASKSQRLSKVANWTCGVKSYSSMSIVLGREEIMILSGRDFWGTWTRNCCFRT